MRSILVALVVPLLLSLACGTSAEPRFDVEVTLAPPLDGSIEIVSARGKRPGATNPIDVEVVLRNSGDVVRQLELQGRWEDEGGGFQGGAGDVRVLQPGSEETFSTGTHTTRATSFRLEISETTATADERLTATLAQDARNAPGQGIRYSEQPALELIPPWTPRGKANETPFSASTIFFLPTDRGWELQLHDREFDAVRGTARARSQHPDLQTVFLNLPREPTVGSVFERDMEYGGGYFQIKSSPESMTTTSWNTSIAWKIEVTEWQRVAWDGKGPTYQQGGTASGRIYVAFKGSEHGLANSWISGTFENVPIVYYGQPRRS